MSDKGRSVAIIISQSIPLLVWMQLAIGDMQAKVSDLSLHVKRLEQQAFSLQQQLSEHKAPGKK